MTEHPMVRRSDSLTPSVEWLDEVDSTMRQARRCIEANTAVGPFAIAARRQTAGYGRRGSAWYSPPGGLWMTGAFPGSLVADADSAALRLARACKDAVVELITSHGGIPSCVAIKPPNDILISDRKVAGVIAERFEHAGRRWLLVGVGVNVNNDPADLPSGLRLPPTSLSLHAERPINLADAAGRIIAHLARALLA